jgi:hypothetical protein
MAPRLADGIVTGDIASLTECGVAKPFARCEASAESADLHLVTQ